MFIDTIARGDLNSLTAELDDASNVYLDIFGAIYFHKFVFLAKINQLKNTLVYSISRRNKVYLRIFDNN